MKGFSNFVLLQKSLKWLHLKVRESAVKIATEIAMEDTGEAYLKPMTSVGKKKVAVECGYCLSRRESEWQYELFAVLYFHDHDSGLTKTQFQLLLLT